MTTVEVFAAICASTVVILSAIIGGTWKLSREMSELRAEQKAQAVKVNQMWKWWLGYVGKGFIAEFNPSGD